MGFMIAIGKAKPKEEKSKGFGGDEDTDEDEGDEKSYALSAAKDLLAAMKSGDAEAIDSALRAHYEACQGE